MCTHVLMYVHVGVHMHIFAHVSVYVCVCMRTPVRTCVCTLVHIIVSYGAQSSRPFRSPALGQHSLSNPEFRKVWERSRRHPLGGREYLQILETPFRINIIVQQR